MKIPLKTCLRTLLWQPSIFTFTNLLGHLFLTPYFSVKLDSLTLIFCNKDQLVIFVFEEFFVKCIVSLHLWLSRVKPQAKSLYISRAMRIFLWNRISDLSWLAVLKTPNLTYFILEIKPCGLKFKNSTCLFLE